MKIYLETSCNGEFCGDCLAVFLPEGESHRICLAFQEEIRVRKTTDDSQVERCQDCKDKFGVFKEDRINHSA